MKKLVTLVIIITTVISMKAQDAASAIVLLNYNTVKKKVEKSDADIQDAKKNIKDATWFKRGELFQDVFMAGLEQLQEGMAPATAVLFYKDPTSIDEETIDSALHQTYNYEHMTYTFVDGALQIWKKKDPIHEDPLNEAFESYKKARELDIKAKLDPKIKENMAELKNQFKRDGVNHYYLKNYDEALGSFESVLEINNLDLFAGEVDTIMIQYAGIIAREIASKTNKNELYLKAIEYYKQLIEVDFGGPNTFLQIKNDYLTIGDTLSALEILKEAYRKYPDTVNVIANIADAYILYKHIDEGIEFLDEVISNNPNIPEAYYWSGRLLINKEEVEFIDRAIKTYLKASELDPTLYYVWYDMGYIYYLQGADFYERSNTEEHEATRDRLLELGKENYLESIPALEKAYEYNTVNETVKFETLDLLQRIYYKEQMMEQYNRVKDLKENM